jgi:flagellar hook-associated protein 1 FlgK
MSGLLNTASLALNAFHRGLDIAGNNIANAGTVGYSRRSIIFSPTPSNRLGGFSVGTGVQIQSIYRNVNEFANNRVRSTTTLMSQFETFFSQASQLDGLLSEPGTSISLSMQSFFNSLSKMNDNPDNLPARSVALSQASLLSQQFKNMQNQLDESKSNTNKQIRFNVNEINRIAQNIATINVQLQSVTTSPDLLDTRDKLLEELSLFIQVTAVPEGENGLNITIGKGTSLVSGGIAGNLVIQDAQSDLLTPAILLQTPSGSVDVTSSLDSGALGGLIDYQQTVLVPSMQLIGQMAMGLSVTFNQQHRLGMDMNNQLGKDFFTDYNSSSLMASRSKAFSTNTGTARLTVQITSVNQLALSDYELRVSNAATGAVEVYKKSDGTSQLLTFSPLTPAAPPRAEIQIDGMRIEVDDVTTFATGDKFTIAPTHEAGRYFEILIANPREIANALPVRVSGVSANMGDGQIKLGEVYNTTNVQKSFRIQFTSSTQYQIINDTDSVTTGPFTYTPNTNNAINIPDNTSPSYQVIISGSPQTGDTFTAAFNAGGFGDNRNGLLLASLRDFRTFNSGTETVFDRYANLISDVGGKTYLASVNADAANALNQQAVETQQAVSGVNLDEEGINLIKYQQAYQAASQLVQVANRIITIIFDMMG